MFVSGFSCFLPGHGHFEFMGGGLVQNWVCHSFSCVSVATVGNELRNTIDKDRENGAKRSLTSKNES